MNTSCKQVLRTAIIALNFCGVLTARGEDALNPRTYGDWDHDNAPVPAYRQNCHPVMTECQLPIRPIPKDESDLNGRTSERGRDADLVAIKTVLDDLQHYNLHRVRFEGQVTGLTVLPNAAGCGNFNAYLFQIEDDTGSMEVFDAGACGEDGAYPPLLMWNPVRVGDRIAIAVSIVHSTLAAGSRPKHSCSGSRAYLPSFRNPSEPMSEDRVVPATTRRLGSRSRLDDEMPPGDSPDRMTRLPHGRAASLREKPQKI